jgi:hypothetical protein
MIPSCFLASAAIVLVVQHPTIHHWVAGIFEQAKSCDVCKKASARSVIFLLVIFSWSSSFSSASSKRNLSPARMNHHHHFIHLLFAVFHLSLVVPAS